MSGLFAPKAQKMPAIEPPTPMPDATTTEAARRRRIAMETAGQGYQSTILSVGGRETLGG